MSSGFEVPTHEALMAEQAVIQAEKFQGRLLSEYNSYIFPGQNWREPRSSDVTDFLRKFAIDNELVSLETVLAGLCELKGQSVNWVDMGGGRALPMRQLGINPDTQSWLDMTNVDLFNFGLDGLNPEEIKFLEEQAPGMTTEAAQPALINDDVEKVVLPEPADVITSIETMQYLNDPLRALANWYNQLADNGLLIVATEHDWASWIRYKLKPRDGRQDGTPTKHLLESLAQNGINYAITDEMDWPTGHRPIIDPSRFRIMVIQKKPDTSLRITKPVSEVWINPYDFKAVYYGSLKPENSPIIEVMSP